MKGLLSILLLFTLFQSSAQNLVPNPSFEDTIQCPDNLNQVNRAVGWSSYSRTPDYYNVCNNFLPGGPEMGVPSNFQGYQYAADGNAYCGLISWTSDGFSNREFIGCELITPLVSGTKYYVSMKLNFQYRQNSVCWNTAINNMGIRFTNTQYSEFSPHPTDNYCHVCADEFIYDTLDWKQICKSFIPTQSYQFMVIGNFFTDIDTDTMTLFPPTNCGDCSAYNVDDIVVSTDSSLCFQEPVGLIEYSKEDKKLIQIVDLMGRETEYKPNTPLIYIYSDGTTEKVFRIE